MQPVANPAESILLVDLSSRAKLLLTGGDRVRFLNGQVSNDVRRASADRSVYACVMTIKGKMCADAFIHAAAGGLLVDTEPELRESLAARLERYIIADDVQLEDVTDSFALWHLLIPDLETAGPPAFLSNLLETVQAVRSTRYGREGLDLFFQPSLTEELRAQLPTACHEPTNAELETLRIAAGVPRWGADLDENTMPAEAGIEARAVDYAKGCYIGQEIVSRIKSVGHVNRALRGLRSRDPALAPSAGMSLYSPRLADEPRGREIGRITSVSPGGAGKPAIALGYVRRGWDDPGTPLDALLPAAPDAGAAPEAICPVEVCTLPFPP